MFTPKDEQKTGGMTVIQKLESDAGLTFESLLRMAKITKLKRSPCRGRAATSNPTRVYFFMTIVPIFQKQAFQYITDNHRHHIKPVGSVFQLAAERRNANNFDLICGVVIVGRPVSRHMQDGKTLEVTRLCTDGYANVCSFLYSASWRVAKEMGYDRLITYILDTEPGISPKAAGWHKVKDSPGGSWSVPSRPRIDKHPTQPKQMFMITSRPHG